MRSEGKLVQKPLCSDSRVSHPREVRRHWPAAWSAGGREGKATMLTRAARGAAAHPAKQVRVTGINSPPSVLSAQASSCSTSTIDALPSSSADRVPSSPLDSEEEPGKISVRGIPMSAGSTLPRRYVSQAAPQGRPTWKRSEPLNSGAEVELNGKHLDAPFMDAADDMLSGELLSGELADEEGS